MTDHIDTAQERKCLRTQAWGLLPRLARVRVGDLLDALDAERVRAEKAEAEQEALRKEAASYHDAYEQAKEGRDRALARLAAAYEAASVLPGTPDWRWRFEPSWSAHELAEAIRALIPADAEAALQRVVDAAWNEAIEAAARVQDMTHQEGANAAGQHHAILALKRPEASHE